MRYAILIVILIVSMVQDARAEEGFSQWVAAFKTQAQSEGISRKTLEAAFTHIDKPIKRVIELDRKQPEGTIKFSQYKKNILNKARIAQGRSLYQKHRAALERAAQKYGVPAQYIVALWGIETSYGNNTGGFNIIHALATLAYDGRRSSFFRKELIDALRIIDAGHITVEKMRGSWAGAMGQNQFMPSSFHRFAIDGNDDGRRDIWGSLDDVFASTANYLGSSGWRADEKWGRRVILPKGFAEEKIGLKISKSLEVWNKMGVRLPDGAALPQATGLKASIVAPDGLGGEAYLVYDNYRVIMQWNKSTYFATSVGLLADQIAQP